MATMAEKVAEKRDFMALMGARWGPGNTEKQLISFADGSELVIELNGADHPCSPQTVWKAA